MTGLACSVVGCDGNASHLAGGRLGYCHAHYRRFKRHGDPLAGKVSHGTLVAWIEAHATFAGEECLPWPFARGADGYGRIRYRDRCMTSHRAMCIEAHGEPPHPSYAAAHRCGQGKQLACMNPTHIRWATKAENEADKLIHGTHNSQRRNSGMFPRVAAE